MANLKRLCYHEYTGIAVWTVLTGRDHTKINTAIERDIAREVNASNVKIILVRSGCHIATIFQSVIGEDRDFVARLASLCFRSNCSKAPRVCAEQVADLFSMSRANLVA